MDKMLMLECPNCEQVFPTYGDLYKEVKCPKCGDKFTIYQENIKEDITTKPPEPPEGEESLATESATAGFLLFMFWFILFVGIVVMVSDSITLGAAMVLVSPLFAGLAKLIKVGLQISINLKSSKINEKM